MKIRSGISLPELLISLAIVAVLMTAVGASYSASASAIEINERMFRATQTARIAMNRALHDLRNAEVVTVGTLAAQANSTVTDTFIDVINPDGSMVSYVYQPADRIVYLVQRDVEEEPQFVLARNVDSAVFTADVQPHPQTGHRRTVRVTIDLIIQIENQAVRLSGSATPRRAMVY
ncbi:MAG TPA: prepilin-type N-terminal cleavage/methylation domain-containing protein [Tepidisphaeraceae bacterium]|mgnify:CR=1 FL=1|nr:prepilin-type N-terminal cleavage/methylation domain-containing protein [Tepidisphaeraceae bacterium]